VTAAIDIPLQAQAKSKSPAHSSQEQPVSIVQVAQDVADHINATEAHVPTGSHREKHRETKTVTLGLVETAAESFCLKGRIKSEPLVGVEGKSGTKCEEEVQQGDSTRSSAAVAWCTLHIVQHEWQQARCRNRA
jgi:hypothetical protein